MENNFYFVRTGMAIALAGAIVACGSSQKSSLSGDVGESHPGQDLDNPTGATPTTPSTAAAPTEGAPVAESDAGVSEFPEPSPVTFILKNTGTEELAFNMDRGWQPNIFAFTGTPPKAKSIQMFPSHCTATCSVDAEERCPVCAEPERVKDIRAAEKREIVAPGAQVAVPWGAQVLGYKRTKGSHEGRARRCKCFDTGPVPEATYTVRACGLRITKVATKRSRLQCVDAEMSFPAEGPIEVVFEFSDEQPKKKKRRR